MSWRMPLLPACITTGTVTIVINILIIVIITIIIIITTIIIIIAIIIIIFFFFIIIIITITITIITTTTHPLSPPCNLATMQRAALGSHERPRRPVRHARQSRRRLQLEEFLRRVSLRRGRGCGPHGGKRRHTLALRRV